MSERTKAELAARIADLSPEKRALLADRLKGRTALSEPIAVVGVGCRFPGADGKEAFWQLLRDGVDAVGEVPADRWNVEALYNPDPLSPGTVTTKWGGFLADIDRFDAGFFGIAPREAARMDPQQRLLLEVAWHAFEDAGQTREMLAGSRTGVFVGIHSHSADYAALQFADVDGMDAFTATGTSHNFMSGRLSYWLDLQGPSLVVDTACSSSLVAVHLACQSLRAGECAMALVGGANLMVTPQFTIAASRMHMLSPDGRCKAFDAAANGFVRGEGCGAVVLKRLSDAHAAGDRVLAVIRGTAVNQDGRTNGITAPNGASQQNVIREALRMSGLDAGQVTYVEAHGTGTPLGDPIEVESLGAVLGARTPGGDRCALGSAKTNLGHLEGAAGIAGLIKVVLCLQHRQVPPVVHFRELNPHIALAGTRLEIPTALREWRVSSGRRVAGLSSFGWSGTNAHAIVEEAPQQAQPAADAAPPRPRMLAISGRTPEALDALGRSWSAWFAGPGANAAIGDVCDTAGRRRAHHEHRAALVGSSIAELADRLSTLLGGESHPDVTIGRTAERSGIVFVFPGQGSQWIGMGRELYAHEPAFRDAIDAIGVALSRHVEWSLVERLHADAATSPLDPIDVVQPVLFAIEVALAALWRARGVQPDAVVGHSMGEVAAAHVAGALSLDDAARIICQRSRLLRRVSGRGAMAALELSMEETTQAIASYPGRLSVAVSNSPTSTVISGDTDAIDEVLAVLDERDVFCRRIKVDVASHSPHMDPLRGDLLSAITGIQPCPAAVPLYSTVTALPIQGAELNGGYWVRNLREPVLMSKAVEKLALDGHSTFIEMSPHPILLPAVETTMRALDREALTLPSLRRGEGELGVMLASAARLYVAGHGIDWSAVNGPGHFVDVPRYPFQRERYWLEPSVSGTATASAVTTGRGTHPIVGAALNVADRPGVRLWQFSLEPKRLGYLLDHRLDGTALLPASVSIEIVLACCAELFGDVPVSIHGLELVRPLVMAEGAAALLQVSAAPSEDGRTALKMFTVDGGDARLLVRAHVSALRLDPADARQPVPSADAAGLSGAEFYTWLEQRGVVIGDALRSVRSVTTTLKGVTADVAVSGEQAKGLDAYRCAPALTDGLLQLTAIATGDGSDLYLPARCGEVRWYGRPASRLSASVERLATSGAEPASEIQQDLRLLDESGAPVLELLGLQLRAFGGNRRAPQRLEDSIYEVQWEQADSDPHKTVKPPSKQEQWLIFADRGGIGAGIADWLNRKGQLTTVIDAGHIGDLDAVLDAALGAGQRACRGVVFARALDAGEPVDAVALQHSFVDGAVAALQLVQALVRQDWAQTPRVWFVTRGAQPIGDGAMAPWQTPLLGLGRVVAEEHHELFGALIDLDPAGTLDAVLADLGAAIWDPDNEPEVAYRSHRRYVPRLARRAAAPAVSPSIRRDGSYVVTGAFGAVGALAARWLVEQGARRLVLIGRTALPPRGEWSTLDPASASGRRTALVRELESAGASVHVASMPVDDEAAVSAYFDAFEREGWPPVKGVLHCATVFDAALISRTAPAAFANAMRAKAAGAFVLERRLAHAPLDFFVNFSSIAAWLPQPGQASYAAGNAFLDALATSRRRAGRPMLSVNWAVWRGLATAAGLREGANDYEARGIAAFDAPDGFEVMRRLLSDGAANAIVMPVDWARYRAARGAAETRLVANLAAESEESDASAPPASFRELLQGAPAPDRRGLLETHLQEHLARVLRLPVSRLEPLTPLGSLGLESLMTLEFRNRLDASLGIKLSATLVWNHPTVRALATYLATRLDLALDEPETATPGPTITPAIDFTADIADLSEDDALRALMGKA